MSRRIIVKVQLPIESNVKDAPCLVYNGDRSIFQHFPVTPELRAVFDEGEFKAFFYATYDKKTKMLNLEEHAPWQEW